MASTELIEFLPDGCTPNAVPHTYGCIGTRDTATVPNTYGFNLPTDFGTTNATDTYFHAIDDLANGITYPYPPATSNPTTPTICTNVTGIQAFLNSINSGITYNVNAFNEIVLTFANVGDESNWAFWLGTSTPDNYTNKLTPTLHDLQVDTQTYQQVQVIKYQQTDGTFIDKFFVPSGDVLVEVALKPENTFKFGNCPDCKKDIFATHIKYHYIAGDPIPAGYVAYQPTTTLDVRYAGGNASNVYLHCILPILNGSQTPTTYGGQLNDYFVNPQPGIIFTDVATIQAMTDASAVDMGLQASDFIYAVVNNQPIWYLSPAAIAAIPAPTYLHIYFGQTPDHNQYDENSDVTVLANVIPPSCTPIQQVKEKDSCTGLETYRYIIEDGAGNLVDAASVITGFDEANIVMSCPEPVAEEFDIKEREVCVTIDGSAQIYEAIKVYKRSRTSGLATLIHYESKEGSVINGTIVEVCCTCDSLCDVPTATSNKVGFGYATLFNGRIVAGDRVTAGEELYLDYLEVDGNILINSTLVVGTVTGGFTATDMGYGIGYNKIVDLLNTVPEFAANGVRFVTAAAPMAPNGSSYDPMSWGVEYDDTKDVRIVLRDKLNPSGASHSYSIRLNPDPAQTYDVLINVVIDAANDWDINNVVNYGQACPLTITAI